MRKLIFIIFAVMLMASCSTPMERSETASEFGDVIWRSHPSHGDVREMFLCVDEHGTMWVVTVSGGGSKVRSSNKIIGYKAEPSL